MRVVEEIVQETFFFARWLHGELKRESGGGVRGQQPAKLVPSIRKKGRFTRGEVISSSLVLIIPFFTYTD